MHGRRSPSHAALTLVVAAMILIPAGPGLITAASQQQPQQQQQPPPPPPPAQPSVVESAQVPDDELENFVRSVKEVNVIQADLREKLAAVQEPAAAQQLQQEANAEMATIIQGCELEVERYNELARSVSASAELSQRFEAKTQELDEKDDVEPCVSAQ
jgi:hypothetical protein